MMTGTSEIKVELNHGESKKQRERKRGPTYVPPPPIVIISMLLVCETLVLCDKYQPASSTDYRLPHHTNMVALSLGVVRISVTSSALILAGG
jgi:hypothetical protein